MSIQWENVALPSHPRTTAGQRRPRLARQAGGAGGCCWFKYPCFRCEAPLPLEMTKPTNSVKSSLSSSLLSQSCRQLPFHWTSVGAQQFSSCAWEASRCGTGRLEGPLCSMIGSSCAQVLRYASARRCTPVDVPPPDMSLAEQLA
jgi:hypothetical protein